MIPIDLLALAALIRPYEGLTLGTYNDCGQQDCGYGHKLLPGESPCRSVSEAEHYLMADLERCRKEISGIAGDQSEHVQKALMAMDYQLGLTRLLKFKRMFSALHDHNISAAMYEASYSSWGANYPQRLNVVIKLMGEK